MTLYPEFPSLTVIYAITITTEYGNFHGRSGDTFLSLAIHDDPRVCGRRAEEEFERKRRGNPVSSGSAAPPGMQRVKMAPAASGRRAMSRDSGRSMSVIPDVR